MVVSVCAVALFATAAPSSVMRAAGFVAHSVDRLEDSVARLVETHLLHARRPGLRPPADQSIAG